MVVLKTRTDLLCFIADLPPDGEGPPALLASAKDAEALHAIERQFDKYASKGRVYSIIAFL